MVELAIPPQVVDAQILEFPDRRSFVDGKCNPSTLHFVENYIVDCASHGIQLIDSSNSSIVNWSISQLIEKSFRRFPNSSNSFNRLSPLVEFISPICSTHRIRCTHNRPFFTTHSVYMVEALVTQLKLQLVSSLNELGHVWTDFQLL